MRTTITVVLTSVAALCLLCSFITQSTATAPPKQSTLNAFTWMGLDAEEEEDKEKKPGLQKQKKAVQDFMSSAIKEFKNKAIQELIKMQEESGRWSYEAYHRDGEEPEGLPLGFQVGGTAIVSEALLLTAPEDDDVKSALKRGLDWLLQALRHPKMTPRTWEAYDVRIWGHCFALQFLCRARAHKWLTEKYPPGEVDDWITRLVEIIVEEESPGGGWNYASRANPAAFVTAPMVQALLLARSQGEKVPDDVLDRAREIFEASRNADGSFLYGGTKQRPAGGGGGLPGSASRALACETTLVLCGAGSVDAVQFAIENFYENWEHLEVRRQQPGTHLPPYGIASYYFYFGHRFAAQAIELLPEEKRAPERERLMLTLLKTCDEDGTWNDRTFKRSRNVGTAFVLLALLGEKYPLPPKLTKNKENE